MFIHQALCYDVFDFVVATFTLFNIFKMVRDASEIYRSQTGSMLTEDNLAPSHTDDMLTQIAGNEMGLN